jgi:chromosome segregation ATPase
MTDLTIATADICPHGGSSSLCEWCGYKAQIPHLLAKIDALKAENSALAAERDNWKWEYDNLCKFTNQFEAERDAFKAENAKLKADIEEIKEKLWAQVYHQNEQRLEAIKERDALRDENAALLAALEKIAKPCPILEEQWTDLKDDDEQVHLFMESTARRRKLAREALNQGAPIVTD